MHLLKIEINVEVKDVEGYTFIKMMEVALNTKKTNSTKRGTKKQFMHKELKFFFNPFQSEKSPLDE